MKKLILWVKKNNIKDKIKGGFSKSRQKDNVYLYQTPKNNEIFNPNFIKTVSIAFITILFALLIVASFTQITEAAVASGEIQPIGDSIQIKHFDGGLVSGIYVNEGDVVKKGSLLLSLDGIGAQEDLDLYVTKNNNLRLQEERYQSLIHNKKPDFAGITNDQHAMNEQMAIYQSMLAAYDSDKSVISKQIQQKTYELESLRSKKANYEKEIELSKKIVNMYEKLANGGHTSKLTLLQETRRLLKLEGEYKSLSISIKKDEQAVEEYRSRLHSYDKNKISTLNQQYEKIVSEIQANSDIIKKLQQKSKRMSLRSPVSGIIKAKNINALGTSVHPNQILFEIIPLSTPLVAELHISPDDVGHVKPGDPVKIKISAYDYIKYGMVQGKLYYISADTFTNEDHPFYKGLARLERNYLESGDRKLYLIPGMLLKAEIITGERTVMEYLLKPIYRAMDSGLMER